MRLSFNLGPTILEGYLAKKLCSFQAFSLLVQVGGRPLLAGAGHSKIKTNLSQLSWAGAWAELGNNVETRWSELCQTQTQVWPGEPDHYLLSIILLISNHLKGGAAKMQIAKFCFVISQLQSVRALKLWPRPLPINHIFIHSWVRLNCTQWEIICQGYTILKNN